MPADFQIIDINTLSDETIRQTLAAMSPLRRARISAYPPRRLRQSAAAEYLARELLFRRTGMRFVTIEQDENGRPYPKNCPCFLSLSHSGGLAAAAVSDVPVGVDIEIFRSVSPAVLRHFATETEAAYAGQDPERILRLWTLKEAYYKASALPFAAVRETDLTRLLDRSFLRDGAVCALLTTADI